MNCYKGNIGWILDDPLQWYGNIKTSGLGHLCTYCVLIEGVETLIIKLYGLTSITWHLVYNAMCLDKLYAVSHLGIIKEYIDFCVVITDNSLLLPTPLSVDIP